MLKANIRYVMSVCQFGSHWTDFHEIWYFNIFRKSVEKVQVSLKSDMNNEYFKGRPMYILITSRSVLLRMRNVSYKSCRENKDRHFRLSSFFPKHLPIMRYFVKIQQSRAGHRWQNNMAHALWMSDNWRYKRTLRICNTAFPRQQWLANAPHYYTCTAPLLTV